MATDKILVDRETDGERCGNACPSACGYECVYFNESLTPHKGGIPASMRCTSCLSTPSARELTPEMVEAVNEALEKLTTYDEDGMFYSINEMLQAAAKLRAAFGIEEA